MAAPKAMPFCQKFKSVQLLRIRSHHSRRQSTPLMGLQFRSWSNVYFAL